MYNYTFITFKNKSPNIMNLNKLLHEKWTYSMRRGYCTIEGYTLTRRYSELKNDIDNLEVNEEDIWICTYPKTGTTWVQEMVWMILNNLDFEKGQKLLEERAGPFIDFSAYYEEDEIAKFEVPMFMRDSVGFYKSFVGPKMVKTHLPYELLPKEITSGAKKPKIIYVTRNPKDTCVSYYHHSRLMEGYKGTFGEFCELFLGGKALYAPYSKHILSFWEHRNSPNFLFLKYENMKRNLAEAVVETSKFLEKDLTPNQVDILTKHLSFDSMKGNKAVNKEGVKEMNKILKMATDATGEFMRSGTISSYKAIMDEDMSTRFDEWVEREFDNSGFSFGI